jgi:hypothetical protein
MSFLNPVSEPVLRFSSTDADAPQINYNARVAGDVKTVLKACLVTGYGDKASAGWSIANEVDHVAEFVSPSAAMSDYRLGVDDTSTSITTWYYQYQDVRNNPSKNNLSKNFGFITAADPLTGWQMLVTQRGFYFIEHFLSTAVNDVVSRVIYIGQVKSAITDSGGKNLAFWSLGYNATTYPFQFFNDKDSSRTISINESNNIGINAANIAVFYGNPKLFGVSNVSVVSEVFLHNGYMAGTHPGLLLHDNNNLNDVFGIKESNVAGRSVLDVCVTRSYNTRDVVESNARNIMIYLDYWEY